MSRIERIGPSRYSNTRSRIVIHQGVAITVATASKKSDSVFEQSRDALANIDEHLAEIGVDRSRVLFVTIYLSKIEDKAEFNRAWDEWVDPENLPLRACAGVQLEASDLVELVVTTAVEK